MTRTCSKNIGPDLVNVLSYVCIATVIFIAGCGGSAETETADVGESETAAPKEPVTDTKPKAAPTPAPDPQQENTPAADTPAALDVNVQPVAETAVAATDGSEKLMLMLTVFMLAVFVGVEIITKIPPTLHTPLMSGSNAISGITLIGAVLATGSGQGAFASFLGFFAVVFATVNCVGGFLVTHRMLDMFRKKK